MRISDWSSDVCSSDLGQVDATLFAQLRADTLRVNPEFKRQTMTDLYGPLRDNSLDPGEKGEPIFETRLQLEGLGYISHAQRNWNTDRIYNQQLENAVRQFQDRKSTRLNSSH